LAPPLADKATEVNVRGPSDHGFYVHVKAQTVHEAIDALLSSIARERDELAQQDAAAPNPSSRSETMSKSTSKPKSKSEFRITAKRQWALSVAANAWIDTPGSHTNYNGASEIKVAKALIDAGYLAKTGEATFAGKAELQAKLTDKGRRWVIDNLKSLTDENRLRLAGDGVAGPSAMSKPATKPKPKTAKPKTAKPKTAKPKAVKPKATKPKAAKPKAAKPKAAKPKAATKKLKAAKKPNWSYTTHRDARHRFREIDGQFTVERRKGDVWVAASASASAAIHEKSESACALAARILPTCGAGKQRTPRITQGQKQSMRKLLGL
jgi:outer membrane biosynthesis protein TonB